MQGWSKGSRYMLFVGLLVAVLGAALFFVVRNQPLAIWSPVQVKTTPQATHTAQKTPSTVQVPAHNGAQKKLMLIGGGLEADNAQIYEMVVKLAGGSGVARIGIITAAGFPEEVESQQGDDTPSSRGKVYAQRFKEQYHAADAQWIPIDLTQVQNNESPEVVQQINSMTGFYFTGGQQTRLMESFYTRGHVASPALRALHHKYEQGALIAGSSAGSAALTTANMLTPGGESYEALRNGLFTEEQQDKNDMYYQPQGGLKFFPYGVLDTHFSERGRQGRLLRVLADSGQQFGYGIDEDTALIVTNVDQPDVKMRVIGSHGVSIMDLTQAQVQRVPHFGIYNVRMTYLTQDDSYSPLTHEATIASWKPLNSIVSQLTTETILSEDIFSSLQHGRGDRRAEPRAFISTAQALFASSLITISGNSYEQQPVYTVTMTKDAASASAGYQGIQGMTIYASFTHLRVDIFVG